MVRLWLHKLCRSSTGDRVTRNTYLAELCRQVEQGWLQTPFNEAPPVSPLVPLATAPHGLKMNDTSSSWSDMTDTTDQTCCPPNYILPKNGKKLPVLYDLNTRYGTCSQTGWQCLEPPHNNINQKYKQAVNCFFNQQPRCMTMNNGFKNPDEQYLKTVASLEGVIKDLQKQNEYLAKEMVQCQRSASLGNAHVESDIRTLSHDITSLKSKLEELKKIKAALEVSHKDVVAQYQKDVNATMTSLSQRLREAQNKNQCLEKSVQIVMQRLDNLETQRNNKWQQLVLKEAAIFQKKLMELRKRHVEKIQEFETSISSLNKELCAKSNEVVRLENLLKQQCSRMQEEVKDIHRDIEETSKVKFLKKAVLKHEKFSRKITHYYEKRMQELEKDMQVEVKDLQVQMRAQKTVLSTAMADEKQKEIDELVTKLEERYRRLLMDLEQQASEQNQKDQKRITELEVQLALLRAAKSDCKTTSIHSV